MRGKRQIVLLLAALTVCGAIASTASAGYVTKTVAGTYLLLDGNAPDDPTVCIAVAFATWKYAPNTIRATVFHKDWGRRTTKSKAAPFNDYNTFFAQPKDRQWIALATSSKDYNEPIDCADILPEYRREYQGAVTVVLTVRESNRCVQARKTLESRSARVKQIRRQLARVKSSETKKELSALLLRAKLLETKARLRVKKVCP